MLPLEATHQRRTFEQSFGFFGGDVGPKCAVISGGVHYGGEAGIDVQWSGGVVGAAGLTFVAAEYPTVGVEILSVGALLNCSI